jgi:hypothetical protein
VTDDEKINKLIKMEDMTELDDNDFEFVKSLSSDEDAFVRSQCAVILGYFVNNESLNILLNLSKDEDALVRTEAYDSLGEFHDDKVMEILYEALSSESDNLARSYAIMSWSHIISVTQNEFEDKAELLLRKMETEENDRCILCYCFEVYLLGYELILKKILGFLKNEDCNIRHTTISMLHEITNDKNKEEIKSSVRALVKTEDNPGVKSDALKLLKEH